jgi:hypothetical protein
MPASARACEACWASERLSKWAMIVCVMEVLRPL